MPDGTAAWEAGGGAQTQPVLPDAAAQQSHNASSSRGTKRARTTVDGRGRRLEKNVRDEQCDSNTHRLMQLYLTLIVKFEDTIVIMTGKALQ